MATALLVLTLVAVFTLGVRSVVRLQDEEIRGEDDE